MTAILVTGGAGYIGSHTVRQLLKAGNSVVVLDNLSTGNRNWVPPEAVFIEGNAGDIPLVEGLLKKQSITAIIHFAGSLSVPESVEKPLAYYQNNTCVSRNLIEAAIKGRVDQFIFSSTAAVYGIPEKNPVDELAPLAPINPYGRSKLMTEWMLEDAAKSSSLRFVILRYFNVAGGIASPNATHLIKMASDVVRGKSKSLTIFGTDYPTADGTGVRDYIHVEDLASAHLAALQYLDRGGKSEILNCGYGHGYSVREVVRALERVSGTTIPIVEGPRRAGDPPAVISDNQKIKILQWSPQHDDLEDICKSALV